MRSLLQTLLIIVLSALLGSCATLGSRNDGEVYQTGNASWYGQKFQGRPTASGERFDMKDLTAAHRTLPFGQRILVKSLTTGRTVSVRINDRGPFHSDRVLDMSYAAASQLDILSKGQDRVEIRLVKE
jgi:rare lipoprotein A